MINIFIRENSIRNRVRLFKTVMYFLNNDEKVIVYKKKAIDDDLKEEKLKVVNVMSTQKSKIKENLFWIVILFFRVAKCRNKIRNNTNVAIGFDSAIVLFLLNRFFGISYIYDNADNFFQSHNFPKILKKIIFHMERRVILKSKKSFFPNEERVRVFNLKSFNNIYIIRNFPSNYDINEAERFIVKNAFKLDKKLKYVYINGWVNEGRGLQMLEDLISHVKDNDNIRFLFAGNFDKKMINSKYVLLLGNLSSSESLSYYYLGDFLFSFYDPDIEINRNACPNKWGDAITFNTHILTNYGINSAKSYFNNYSNVSYFEYGNSKKVYEFIKNYEPKEKKTHILDKTLSWEFQLDQIFKEECNR